MRKTLICVFVAGVVILTTSCSGPPKRPGGPECFLWRVESESATVHILGSFRFGSPDMYPLHSKVEMAYRSSSTLVVEIDEEDPSAIRRVLADRAVYTDGSTFKDHVSADTYRRAAAALAKYGEELSPVDVRKPWTIAVTLEQHELDRQGFAPEYGVDRHFLKRARKQKPILELGSAEEQVRIWDEEPADHQEAFLRMSLLKIEGMAESLDRLVKAWREGDTAAYEAVVKENLAGSEDILPVYGATIYRRNEAMAKVIEGYLAGGGTYFVVISPAHLIGEKGIISLLARHGGYSVKQL